MKKIKFFSFASAVLLASAAGMTSCSSDSIEPTGGSGVAGQVVKTQFVINIPYAGNESGGNARVSTRMTADNTQNSNNFLGLKDIKMFAYDKAPSETNTTSTRTIRIRTDAPSSNNDYRRIYSDIAIPVGTTNMILYARATRTKNVALSPTNKTNFEAGSLTNPYGNFTDEAKPNLSDFKFNLETIHSANDFANKGYYILSKLNAIAQTEVTDGEATIKWSNINDATSYGTEEERNILQKLYTNFVSLSAGSENSVKRAIDDLKAAVETQKLTNCKTLTDAIKDKCTTNDLTTTRFPRNYDLPDGAAVLKFNKETRTFAYEEGITVVTTGSNLVDYTKITYPSELAYFVSSPVRTSSTKDKLTDLPDYKAWLGNTADWGQYGDVVKSNTTLVVLKEPVQYGVACLESKIKCGNTTLEDNAKDILKSTAENNILTVPEEGIKVTGILIGGQPQGVEWNFEPASSATFDHTIYDKDISGIVAQTSYSNPNYTLVLDNKNSSTTDPTQSEVNVTVELENNMGDFYGKDGLIPNGSRFYLVGQLDPNASTATKPNGETIDRVFVKDHTTVANFTITNLKNAYNHIPDLRTSKINVGLAVDLSWQDGITFDVDL